MPKKTVKKKETEKPMEGKGRMTMEAVIRLEKKVYELSQRLDRIVDAVSKSKSCKGL